MTSLAVPARYDSSALLAGVGALSLSVAAGASIAAGYSFEAIAFAATALAFVIGISNWRVSVIGLLLFIPVSGIAIVAAYPHTGPATLIKDLLFVLPAYAGFAMCAMRGTARMSFRGAPTNLFILVGILVLIQALNPDVPNPLVAAIGVKVWLLYMPLYFLGYNFVRSFHDLGVLLRVICLGALVPVSVGIVQATLIYSGSADSVYGLYGDAAGSVTQNFAQLSYPGGATVRRVPSTFSFVTQYYAYLVAITALAYAWWRFSDTGRVGRLFRGVLWGAVLAAAFLSGARVAFLSIPLLVLLLAVLDRHGRKFAPVAALSVGLALVAAAAVVGTTARSAVTHSIDLATHEFRDIFINGFGHALSTTLFGLGTGTDTSATRYAFAENRVGGAEGTWFESWHVKVVLELGLVGLAIVGLLIGAIVLRGLAGHRQLKDPSLRAVSAAILGFLLLNVVAGFKGQYLDFDPTNVYFWFLAGVLMRLPLLDSGSERAK